MPNDYPGNACPESGQPPTGGYDTLGKLMGKIPEATAFLRFGALSAEDLLYMQAEIVELERRLRDYQRDDKQSTNKDRQQYSVNWARLRDSCEDDAASGNDSLQIETILELRGKLKEYRGFEGYPILQPPFADYHFRRSAIKAPPCPQASSPSEGTN